MKPGAIVALSALLVGLLIVCGQLIWLVGPR